MIKDSQPLSEKIAQKITELMQDPSPLAQDYIELGSAFLKYIERTEKIMDIADKYLADLKYTSDQLILTKKALQENEEKFISIFEETPDPILILDASDHILEVNHGFETIFDIAQESILGKRIDDLAVQLTKDIIGDVLTKSGANQHISHIEMSLLKKSGVPFTAEVSFSRITIHDEPCLIIQIHDIDEIRKAHDAVSMVNQKLQILSSITRHDILNRVMVTSGYAEMLLMDITEPAHQKRINAIITSNREISTLIDFTKQYQDLGSAEPAWQSIEIILQSVIIKSLITRVDLRSDLGYWEIYADKMLEKVIYNLVENSMRHGKNISRIMLSAQQDGGELIICYEDDGGGITNEDKKKIFQKGFGKNTGMGLFLIREILSITGITIIENGEPGVGVRFEIRVQAGKWRMKSSL